jgi:hypothetical protein
VNDAAMPPIAGAMPCGGTRWQHGGGGSCHGHAHRCRNVDALPAAATATTTATAAAATAAALPAAMLPPLTTRCRLAA